ncbi:Hsp20/alpha crystallin family protein [Vulgatibacter sp.]|uniref:Hsp20/alpha crystallin family protein n=1 Tax=Vulgatibacter sp. TaxID=1971226 RepID=UPI003561E571
MAFGLSPWDPFREFERIDRLFRRGFESPFGRMAESIGTPAVEITDEEDHYLVKAEIPGVKEEDVEITLSGNMLTLRGEKRIERRAPRTVEARPVGGAGKKAGKEEKGTGKEQNAEAGEKAGGSQALAEGEGSRELSRPLFSEVYYGNFERVLALPDDIDPDKVEATSEHGVFQIRIGKKEQQRARRISVTRH